MATFYSTCEHMQGSFKNDLNSNLMLLLPSFDFLGGSSAIGGSVLSGPHVDRMVVGDPSVDFLHRDVVSANHVALGSLFVLVG